LILLNLKQVVSQKAFNHDLTIRLQSDRYTQHLVTVYFSKLTRHSPARCHGHSQTA